ncbi:FAD-dependent oxidoreductase, partial [Eggerthella sp.]|uniref:FAD-dependent oxidoreductase n=1 Tax=Eggerthella sp. TaxID=1929886 RepID=UPI002846839F
MRGAGRPYRIGKKRRKREERNVAETDFDAIVVGSGCAGAVAAYELAKAGKSTLVVERGNFAGAKNMTGGRIY